MSDTGDPPDGQRRERTYWWMQARGDIAPLARCSGLEYFEGMRRQTVPMPPIAQTIGWRVSVVARGAVTLDLADCQHLLNGAGMLAGGALAALLDSAMASAVMTELTAGQGCSTVALNLQLLRSAGADRGPIRVEATTTSLGGRIATAEGRVFDQDERLLARATATCLVFAVDP